MSARGVRLLGLALLLSLGSGAAFGQTYVRPSKGTAFNPFVGQSIYLSSPQGGWSSPVYDWTSFTSVRIQISGIGTGSNGAGVACSSVTPLEHVFNNTNNYIKIQIQVTNNSTEMNVIGSSTKDGSFGLEFQNGYYAVTRYEDSSSAYQKFGGCYLRVTATPLPFEVTTNLADTTTSEVIRASTTECYPGWQTITSQALNPLTWTAIPVTQYSTASVTVCNPITNDFGPVYCAMREANQSALATPPHTLFNGAYVLAQGECRNFGPIAQNTSTGFSVGLPVPYCAAASNVTVGVRTCTVARVPY